MRNLLFLLMAIFSISFSSYVRAEDKKSEAVVKYLFPLETSEKQKNEQEKERTDWDDVVDVGKATMRGGVTGAKSGPYGAAAGAIYEGSKEVIKKTYEDVQRSIEMGENTPTYTSREIEPGENVYISEETVEKYKKQMEEDYRLSHGED